MRWFDGTLTRLRLLLSRRSAEARMGEEIEFHIEMETERLAREEGLAPGEARRRALVAFGGVQKYREELRDGRGMAWLGGLSLDLRLGLRMLAKDPGLALVGTLGLSVAIAVAAGGFSMIFAGLEPTLPGPHGDRIVAIQSVNAEARGRNDRTHLHDLSVWERELRTVRDVGAHRTIDRNLVTPGERAEPVRVAEMSASGFRAFGGVPLLGRVLEAEDERAGAAPVVVIREDVWEERFARDPDVLGQELHLGDARHAIIGVMPRAFGFPVNNRIWTPLRLDAGEFEPGEAPALAVFGRLAPGATLDGAATELETIRLRLAADRPDVYGNIRTRVLPYPRIFLDFPEFSWTYYLIQLLLTMLLVVIGTNVAVLVYARTATRAGEIAVRTALGASRRRVVMQLGAEAFVLAGVSAAIGLGAAWYAVRTANAALVRIGGEHVPFWWDFGLSPGAVAYAAGLAVLAAAIVGVVPALKVTGRGMRGALQRSGTGGGGLRLGGTWTALIVIQVALAVSVLPLALNGVTQWIAYRATDPGFPTHEILTARLHLDLEAPEDEFAPSYAARQAEVARRLEADPRVARVVFATAVPGDEALARMEVRDAESGGAPEAGGVAGDAGILGPAGVAGNPGAGAGAPGAAATDGPPAWSEAHAVRTARVDVDLFRVFDVPLLAGRFFDAGDLVPQVPPVIVNRSFAEHLLGGRNPVGLRIRNAPRAGEAPDGEGEPEGGYEIVGVVSDFPEPVQSRAANARVYLPLAPGAAHPVVLAARAQGTPPAALAPRLREVALAVDPMLRLERVGPLDAILHDQKAETRFMVAGIGLLSLTTLLLSAAGISALMSFTVARRRREIGIRSALGARPHRILTAVLARSLRQVGLGVAAGLVLAVALNRLSGGGMLGERVPLLLLGAGALMAMVAAVAAAAPARRGLRIQPSEALKAE